MPYLLVGPCDIRKHQSSLKLIKRVKWEDFVVVYTLNVKLAASYLFCILKDSLKLQFKYYAEL